MENQPITSIDLFAYKDYRAYLREWFQAAKRGPRAMSFRLFSKRAGLGSPNFLKLVMDGKRGLSVEGIAKFAAGLKLNKVEQEYFQNLVLMNQASDPKEQFSHYRKMIHSKKFARVKPVEKDEFNLYSEWYHPVVREIVESKSFDGTPEWLQQKLSPSITESQARKSLELLERLGFIRKGDDGRFQQSESLVTTGAETDSVILLHYHQTLLKLTAELLSEIQPQDRDVSTLTIGIAKSRIAELKQKIQAFRHEIIREFSSDLPPEEVLLLNVQLVPVTKKEVA